MEILPGVHRIEARFNDRTIASHLLVGERALLVDSGFPWIAADVILPYLDKIGLPAGRLDWLVVTHASSDHHGGNSAIKARFPAVRIVEHRLDAEATSDGWTFVREHGDILQEYGSTIRVTRPDNPRFLELHGPPAGVDWRVDGSEPIALSGDWAVTLLHAPGHTPGHLMLHDAKHSALILGDALMGAGVPDVHGNLVMPPHYFEVAWYRQSIAKARALAPQHIFATHYAPMEGIAAGQFVDASEAFVASCDAAILNILERASTPLDISAIVEGLRDVLGIPSSDYQYALLVRAHLRSLTQAGQATLVAGGSAPHWLRTGSLSTASCRLEG